MCMRTFAAVVDYVTKLFFQDEPAYHFVRETASLEEARALRALFPGGRRLAVLAGKDGLCTLGFAFHSHVVYDFIRDAARLEVLADLRGAVLARKGTSAFFREALVRKVLP